jgi:hypothetical protein
MAHGLTLLTMRHNGGFRLGVKTDKGILDVVEAAARLHMHAPATMDDLLQNQDGPSLNALVDRERCNLGNLASYFLANGASFTGRL